MKTRLALTCFLSLTACKDDDGAKITVDAVPPGVDSAVVTVDANSDIQIDATPVTPDAMVAANTCKTDFAGCTAFTDLTADSAERKVTFTNFAFTAKCIRIKAGQSVTFSGSFSSHPLNQACGPVDDVLASKTGSESMFTFSQTGTYGYYCGNHGAEDGSDMSGAIEVVE